MFISNSLNMDIIRSKDMVLLSRVMAIPLSNRSILTLILTDRRVLPRISDEFSYFLKIDFACDLTCRRRFFCHGIMGLAI